MVTSRDRSAAAVVLVPDPRAPADREARSNAGRKGRHCAPSGIATRDQAQQVCQQLSRTDQLCRAGQQLHATRQMDGVAQHDRPGIVNASQHHRVAHSPRTHSCSQFAQQLQPSTMPISMGEEPIGKPAHLHTFVIHDRDRPVRYLPQLRSKPRDPKSPSQPLRSPELAQPLQPSTMPISMGEEPIGKPAHLHTFVIHDRDRPVRYLPQLRSKPRDPKSPSQPLRSPELAQPLHALGHRRVRTHRWPALTAGNQPIRALARRWHGPWGTPPWPN